MKVCVVGSGRQGKKWINVLSAIETLDIVVVEPNKEQVPQDVVHYPTIEDLPELPAAVVIASPIPFHYEQANYFLRKKVPVLLEKPACASLDKLKDLFFTATGHLTHLQVGYLLRYHPAYKEIVSYSSNKTISEASFTRVLNNPPKPESPVWHLASHDIELALAIGLSVEQIVELPTITFKYGWGAKERQIKTVIKYDTGAKVEWDGGNTLLIVDGKGGERSFNFAKLRVNLLHEQFKDFILKARSTDHSYLSEMWSRDSKTEYAAGLMIKYEKANSNGNGDL